MQITTSWEQKGQSNTILRQLNRKLGNLSGEITTRIKSLEPNQLDILAEDLLDFQTLNDLERWLSNS
jgi:hypothetical protein